MRFAKRWRNFIIISSFQYSEHALESYCHCSPSSVYVIHLKRKQQYFFHLNMSNFVPEKVFLRGVFLHYFNMKKTAAEIHRILVGVLWPYSPDLAPSDYHLFRSVKNALTGIRFTSEQGIKNWLDSFLAAKPAQSFWDGIHKLPERWEKIIASDGPYFEEYYSTCLS